jgi:predicted transcriptional regulator of viral defense system
MRNQLTFDRLYKIAERQHGCFTATQARTAGYSGQSQYHHVKTGDWERLTRGIFRLKYYPRPRRLDLRTYYLWTIGSAGVPQGVFSHETALSLYPYSVWVPLATHMTVPTTFIKRAKPPGELVLHKANLKRSDITVVDDLHVTTPIRTLADLMVDGFVEREHLIQFVMTSLAEGVITDEQIVQAELTDREWELVLPLLKKGGYEKINEIRIAKRLQASA